jgi:glycosyltransferase involved in cell wall biosynthesis
MAMGKIVVASPQAMEGIDAVAGQELVVAENESDFAEQIVTLLSDGTPGTIGTAARRCALERYSWKKNLSKIDALIVQAGKDGEIRMPVRPDGNKLREMRV